MVVRQGAYSAPAAACAAEVLHALRTSDGPVTLAQLERRLPRSKSLIFRVLRELEAREFVMRDHAGGFRLGIEAFEMATAYLGQWAFADVVRQTLRQLANETGDTVNLGVLRGSEVLYLMKFQGASSYVTVSRVGGRVPANCVAIGKALLAELPDSKIEARMKDPLPQMTDHSVQTLSGLLTEVGVVREHGHAIDREQAALGRCALAVVTNAGRSDHELTAMSISTSVSKFDERRDQLLDRLLHARELLERDRLTRTALSTGSDGGNPPDFDLGLPGT